MFSIFFYSSGIVIIDFIKFVIIEFNNYIYLFYIIFRFCFLKRNIGFNNFIFIY